MPKAKTRTHNEWFHEVSLGGRKSCPTCKKKGLQFFSWGEYVNAKFRLVKHFCNACFKEEVLEPLQQHANSCGCEIVLCGKGHFTQGKPKWLGTVLKPICCTTKN